MAQTKNKNLFSPDAVLSIGARQRCKREQGKGYMAKLLPLLSLPLFPAIKALLCLSVLPHHLLWMEKETSYVYAHTQK